MKALATFAFSMLFSPILLAQPNQQPKPESTPAPSITQKQIVELPKGSSYRPSLTLQDALKIAEGYIVKDKIFHLIIYSRLNIFCTATKTTKIRPGISGGLTRMAPLVITWNLWCR
jgi:hypothetical protein